MKNNFHHVRHNLRLLMAQNEIYTLADLSRKAKVDYRTLQNFSSYIHKKLDPELICKLCATFNCSIGELLYIEDEQVS
jgi:DNA-binding Xre family transcriptional regulator